MEFAQSLVVIGSGEAIGEQDSPEIRALIGEHLDRTVGTGILVKLQAQNYLMTCRHVWDCIPAGAVPKAFVSGRPTLYMRKPSVYFHPSDNNFETTDSVFIGLGSQVATQYELIHLSVADLTLPVPDGAQLEVWGYPMDSIMQGREIAPQLVCVSAVAMNVTHADGRPVNYGKRIKRQSVAQITTTRDLSGLSGGLVVLVKNGRRRPLGMLTGSGIGQLLGTTKAQTKVIYYITFGAALLN
jgi:hypothetical protein